MSNETGDKEPTPDPIIPEDLTRDATGLGASLYNYLELSERLPADVREKKSSKLKQKRKKRPDF